MSVNVAHSRISPGGLQEIVVSLKPPEPMTYGGDGAAAAQSCLLVAIRGGKTVKLPLVLNVTHRSARTIIKPTGQAIHKQQVLIVDGAQGLTGSTLEPVALTALSPDPSIRWNVQDPIVNGVGVMTIKAKCNVPAGLKAQCTTLLLPFNGSDQLRHSRAAGDAFVGFTEGDMKFSPTFKVQRKGGFLYKKQRTPSYCDRVLWKTLVPKYASQVRQMLLNGVGDVTTSDHKPVVSALHIAPTPQFEFSKEVEATINLSQLKLTDIMAADLGLTSDPYCRFYTHPPGLLKAGKQGAKTPVIFFVGKNAKVNPLTACCIGAYSEDSVERLKGGNNVCQWKDHNVPHLHLHAPLEKLKDAVLIITVFDFNGTHGHERDGWCNFVNRDSFVIFNPHLNDQGIRWRAPTASREDTSVGRGHVWDNLLDDPSGRLIPARILQEETTQTERALLLGPCVRSRAD